MNDDLARQLGARLKEERLRLGLTQSALAQAVGISRTSATLYEAGKHVPRADVLIALDGLSADLLFLLTGRRAANEAIDEEILVVALEEALRQSGEKIALGSVRELLAKALPVYFALKQLRYVKADAAQSGGFQPRSAPSSDQ